MKKETYEKRKSLKKHVSKEEINKIMIMYNNGTPVKDIKNILNIGKNRIYQIIKEFN